MVGIGQQILQCGIKIAFRLIQANVARGKNSPDNFGHTQALGNSQGNAIIALAGGPTTSRQGPFNTQKEFFRHPSGASLQVAEPVMAFDKTKRAGG